MVKNNSLFNEGLAFQWTLKSPLIAAFDMEDS